MRVSRQRQGLCGGRVRTRDFSHIPTHTCLGYTSFSCLPIFPLEVTLPIKESSWSLDRRLYGLGLPLKLFPVCPVAQLAPDSQAGQAGGASSHSFLWDGSWGLG